MPEVAQNHRPFLQTTDAHTRLFLLWTAFVIFCQSAGWGLSALHALNITSYSIASVFFIAAVALWWKANPSAPSSIFSKLKRRFTRAFPFAFLLLAFLAFLGGVLYSPNNFDGLSYRTPRVLSWLAESRWHWIHSHFGNLNSRGVAFEWITAPIFAFFKTDRFEFIINTVSFLFLPGRIFATLARIGVRPRAAYHWMWIYPAGYGLLLQAGSIGTDLFSAFWPIAALEFALRARATKRVEWLWLSIFAAALMTASKAFNLLLLPAWTIAILPSLLLLARRPVASIVVAAVAAVCSMLPTAILNHHYCGDWTGMAAEPVSLNNGPPLFEFSVNAVIIPLQNFSPPIFPFSGSWDRFITQIIPVSLATKLNQYFEPDAAHFRIPEMQAEEVAGLGFGVTVLLLLVLVRQIRMGLRPSLSFRNFIALAALAGAAIYMAKSGLYAPARYLLPHTFFIVLPIFALPAAYDLTRKLWWRAVAYIMFFLAALLLIISPARPLFPALTLLRNVNESSSPLKQRAARVYNLYRTRPDILLPIREALPPDAQAVGFIALNNPETSLWRPFGSRRILHLRSEDPPEIIRRHGIQYIVVGPNIMGQIFKTTAEDWARQNNGEVIKRFQIQIQARGPLTEWLLIRLNP
jgi:hypothetical protein